MAALLVLQATAAAAAGLHVDGTALKEAGGSAFAMRGVNHPHAWYAQTTGRALKDIAGRGANTVRVVLSAGASGPETSKDEVRDIIRRCRKARLIAVLEVHDTTGYGDNAKAATLASATDYWLRIREVLRGQEDYVVVNIGNEPFGNPAGAEDWLDQNVAAVARLRGAGLKHAIMVDAPQWGQDWKNIMRDHAPQLLQSDPQHNIVFSVHMYESYGSAETVQRYMESFHQRGLALVVGEFGASHQGKSVDAAAIMSTARRYGYGYIGWSWSGNSKDNAGLDLVEGFDSAHLSPWGRKLFEAEDGIKQTARPAAIFGGRHRD